METIKYKGMRPAREGYLCLHSKPNHSKSESFKCGCPGKKTGKGNISDPFEDTNLGDIKLFVPTDELENTYLIEYLDVFDRENDD